MNTAEYLRLRDAWHLKIAWRPSVLHVHLSRTRTREILDVDYVLKLIVRKIVANAGFDRVPRI
jgi:hypothetical protein